MGDGITMSLAQAVDVHANDRGLASCLTAAAVHADVIKHLKDTVKVVTLEDFIHVVSLAAVTSLTIILVFTLSCIIVYRWVELVSLSSVICNMSTHFCLRTMNYFFFQKSDE